MSERVVIFGSRSWRDVQAIRDFVFSLPEGSVVIHGGADGADAIAGRAAQERGLEVVVFKAAWGKYGKAAGPIRNAQMISEGHPTQARGYRRGLKSPGTDGMARLLRRAGIPVTVVEEAVSA
jgi:hypothetical protein